MEIVYSKVLDYLKERVVDFKQSRHIFTCPSCKGLHCNIIPNTARVRCLKCETSFGDILDLVRYFEADKKGWTDDQIIFYLKKKYSLNIVTNIEIEEAFNLYEKNAFDLVPIARNQKIPLEKDWLNKVHKDKVEWNDWINDKLNVGVKTGNRSNITVVDIDTKEIPPSLSSRLTPTLIQETTKGTHHIYQYEKDLPSTRIDELKIDILNDGKQFVIYPSAVDNVRRKFVDTSTPIAKMPPELLAFLKSQITLPNLQSFSEKTKEEITAEDFSDIDLKNINEGNRTNFLIRMGGILRKELNIQHTEYALNLINNHLCKPPLSLREFRNIILSLDKYMAYDDQELALKILNYLRIVDDATARDVKEVLGETKERIDKGLAFLSKEGYIVKKRRMYHVIKRVQWKDTFSEDGTHVNFKMPYFYDVANFRNGDMIVIGGQQKIGKSHIAINIVKQLVEQGIKPYYINLESGNRYSSIAKSLGLKDGDFWNATHFSPEQVELERNAITIIDWLLPKDYAETDKLFQYFAHQLVKNSGILIIFVQLKEDGEFFAKNMVAMFPAFVSRYFYGKGADGSDVPTEGRFQIDYIREPRNKIKKATIPCRYDWDTKVLARIDELGLATEEPLLTIGGE